MPITDSAKKALRASKRKKIFNLRRKDQMKKMINEYKQLLSSKSEDAKKLLPKVQQALDKAAKAGTIKKKTAARKKSRLMKKLSQKS